MGNAIKFEGLTLGLPGESIEIVSLLHRERVGKLVALDASWGEGKCWPEKVWHDQFKRSIVNFRCLSLDHDYTLPMGFRGRRSDVLAFWVYESYNTANLVTKIMVNPAYRRRGVASAIFQAMLYSNRPRPANSVVDLSTEERALHTARFKSVCVAVPIGFPEADVMLQAAGFGSSGIPLGIKQRIGNGSKLLCNPAGEKCVVYSQTLGVPDYAVLVNRVKKYLKGG